MKPGDLSIEVIGLIRLLSFLVCACLIYCIIKLIVQKQKFFTVCGVGALFLSSFVFYALLVDYDTKTDHISKTNTYILYNSNLAVVICILCLFVILALMILLYCFHWEKNHLTAVSVKESLDNLPVGICYCNELGRIVLINNKMHELIREINLKYSLNPILNYSHLKADDSSDPVFETADGRLYILRKKDITTDNGLFTEYLAMDITEKYHLTKLLENENRRLKEKGEQLRSQGKVIDEVILSKEILDTKIKVHNIFGQLLLSSRYALTHYTNETTKTELQNAWKNISVLFSQEENSRQEYSGIEAMGVAARTIGVEIIYQNPIPNDLSAQNIKIFEHILHEALTNCFSHAHADKLFVSFTENETSYELKLTNNGLKPSQKIVEGGGLSSLRKLIEGKKGKMELLSVPEFMLKVVLKK